MITISPSISLADDEITLEFIRSSGPGGQNVNKVSTAAQLRFDVLHSPSLPDDVKQRLIHLAAGRMTTDGVLLIEAKQYRTQEQNKNDAILRLIQLIQRSLEAPRKRRPSRPTLASKNQRIQAKKHRGEIKRLRTQKNNE